MKKLNDFLKKNEIKPLRYSKNGKVLIVDSNTGKYTVKEKKNNKESLYRYLESRSFDYYPNIIKEDSMYTVTEYIEDIDIPKEQKIIDLVDLVSLLHNKTTHYKETTEDEFKKIYEDLKGNVLYLFNYYNDIMNQIESRIYMDPHSYLLARNVSKIYGALSFCKDEIEKWYNLVKNKTKQRYVVLHNNLDLSHFIRNTKSYLINWDKSKIDLPIFDIYKLYKKHYLDFEFSEILTTYERNYPLHEDERLLFFILIALPEKLEFDSNEYNKCIKISNEIDRLYKSEMLISPYITNDQEDTDDSN